MNNSSVARRSPLRPQSPPPAEGPRPLHRPSPSKKMQRLSSARTPAQALGCRRRLGGRVRCRLLSEETGLQPIGAETRWEPTHPKPHKKAQDQRFKPILGSSGCCPARARTSNLLIQSQAPIFVYELKWPDIGKGGKDGYAWGTGSVRKEVTVLPPEPVDDVGNDTPHHELVPLAHLDRGV